MKLKLVITFISFLIILSSCKGQTYSRSIHSEKPDQVHVIGDTTQALDNNIMAIYQDKKNNYWFGGWENGLYKYDGKTILHFTTKHGLPNNRIDEIKEDKSGNMYFVSCHPKSSVVKFDGQSFVELEAIPSNVWKLQPDDLWLRHSYSSEKVYRFDGKTLHELQLPKPTKYTNPFEIYSIYTDKKGNIWFGTNPVGVCRYDGKSFEWITEEDVTEFRNEGANGVRSIAEDKNGDFWFNTEYRYTVYDSTTLKSDQFYTRNESIGGLDGKKNSFLNEYLSALRDDNNNLWFVTYRDGVWKYDGSKITHYVVQDDSEVIKLFSIYKDNNGELWLGSHENGVWRLKGETFSRFKP